MKKLRYLLIAGVCVIAGMAQAQENAAPQNADKFIAENGVGAQPETAKPAPSAELTVKAEEKKDKPQESPDMIARKLELAQKMHQIRPTRAQIDNAIERTAQNLPEKERAVFVANMKGALNYNAVEKISVDAMVETFTLNELEEMVAYHSKPEAQSISVKMVEWAKIVQPEIVKMLDAAMMKARTGENKPATGK